MSAARALITGVTGMVGSHLAEFLLAATDWDIIGLCRWRSPHDNLAALATRIARRDRVTLRHGDLRDALSLDEAVRRSAPDYVFHLAAQSFPAASFEAPLDTLDTNLLGTARLLESLRRHRPAAVVHVCASSEVFGRVEAGDLPIDEACRFHPASPYAISKAGTDLLGRFYAEAYGMTVVTTRMFTHTGPRRGEVFAESSFARQIALIERDLLPPVVKVGNLNSLRTVADVRDAVRAYHMAVTVAPQPGAVYNIGGSFSCTIGHMLQTLLAASPRRDEIAVALDPDRLRPIDADLQVPDTSAFRRHTGWQPVIPFARTMRDLLAYWRERAGREGARLLARSP